MRYSKIIAACGALAVIAGASTLAVTAQAMKHMAPAPKSIKQLISDLDDAIRRELGSGCVETDAQGGKKLCGASKEKIDKLHDETAREIDGRRARLPGVREGAVRAIKKFRGLDQLAIAYNSTSPNPYRDDESVIESYVDDQGNEYWVDPSADRLVQMGPNAGGDQAPHQVGQADRLPVKDLRERAISLADGAVDGFAARRSSLHPLEDNKDKQIYFFRWDDFSAPLKESELPPFVQVALYADGALASFTNTLR